MRPESIIPVGLCQCGCGEPTRISDRNFHKLGIRKGDHFKYIKGHKGKSPGYVVDPQTGCWVWQNRSKEIYCRITWQGKRTLVHRIYYQLACGPIPDTTPLDHLCHNTRCVNPDHLEPVTTAINNQRKKSGKLTRETVGKMRAERNKGDKLSVLANRYGVAQCTVSAVCLGRLWKEHD